MGREAEMLLVLSVCAREEAPRTGRVGQLQALRHDAQPGKRGVAVDEQPSDLARALAGPQPRLHRAHEAHDDRVDRLQVAGVGRDGDPNLALLAALQDWPQLARPQACTAQPIHGPWTTESHFRMLFVHMQARVGARLMLLLVRLAGN